MTYSIVARDPQTGAFGVAVQSHYFSVGSAVPWAEAEVGAVATQAFSKTSYGPKGLDLMRAGDSAEEALHALVTADEHAARRQVAMVDAQGRAAAHTGGQCIDYAGHRTADGVSVQANMMERDTVPDAMLAAYESTAGDLAGRLLAALDAAEGEGGDIRGRQSAAMLIVKGKSSGRPWADRALDLRVEDHPEPLVELRRLVTLHRSYALSSEAEAAAGAGDMPLATAKMTQAMQLAPDNVELAFWAAMSMAMRGEVDDARALLKQATSVDPRWNDLALRLSKTGMYPLSDEVVAAVTSD
jgi:uncharacterized Ntn-hydrolase superfamily protein